MNPLQDLIDQLNDEMDNHVSVDTSPQVPEDSLSEQLDHMKHEHDFRPPNMFGLLCVVGFVIGIMTIVGIILMIQLMFSFM